MILRQLNKLLSCSLWCSLWLFFSASHCFLGTCPGAREQYLLPQNSVWPVDRDIIWPHTRQEYSFRSLPFVPASPAAFFLRRHSTVFETALQASSLTSVKVEATVWVGMGTLCEAHCLFACENCLSLWCFQASQRHGTLLGLVWVGEDGNF